MAEESQPGTRKVNVGDSIDSELDKPLIDPERHIRGIDTGPADKDEWLDFFSRIVLKVGLELYVDFAFRGIDENVVSPDDLRRVTVKREERDIIARPFAEYSVKNKFLRKHSREIVSFADSLESLITLGIWMRKVNRIASKYRPKKEHQRKGSVHREPTGSDERARTNGHQHETGSDGYIIPTIVNPGSG